MNEKLQNERVKPDRIVGYLSPYYAKLARSYANYTGQSNSDVVSEAIKAKFNAMPVSEREMILKFGK